MNDLAVAAQLPLFEAMCEYEAGSPKHIQHFTKVHAYCRAIALAEGMDEHERYVLEAAALVHDIGIRPSKEKYGDSAGHHQEELGPDVARLMLIVLGYEPADIERICWLIAHHHTYDCIEELDHQILVEADFLVNIFEHDIADEQAQRRQAESVRERIFRTATGTRILDAMFLA